MTLILLSYLDVVSKAPASMAAHCNIEDPEQATDCPGSNMTETSLHERATVASDIFGVSNRTLPVFET